MSPVYVFSRSIWLASVRVGRHWPPCCWHKVTPSVGPPRWTQKWNAAGRWLVTQFTTCRKVCHGPGTVQNTCPHSKTDLNATRGVIDIRRSSTIWIIFLVYKSLIFDINILFIWIERIASVCLRKGYQSYDIVIRHQHAHVYGYFIQWIAAARQWAFLEETNGCSTHFKVVVLLFGASVDGTSHGARNDGISRMEYPKPNEKPKNLRIRNNTAYLRDVERS